MFEESLVESTPLLRSRNRTPALISFFAQATLVAAFITLPMLHPEIIPIHAPRLSFLPPPPHPPAPVPPPPQHVQLSTTTNAVFTAPAPALLRPRLTPPPSNEAPTNIPNFNPTSLPMGSGDTNFGTSPLATIGIGNGTHISIAPAPTVGRPGPPTRISQGVSAGLLIAPIQPLYPPIAIAAHQQGTVMVQAIISKSGQIESAHVLSGPTMLQGAALDAVRRARYRPFLLNNEPTEVETTISINFHLGN